MFDYLWYEYLLPFRANRFPSYYTSHSQFGEDMAVRSLFGQKRQGTFIDIGAHHPIFYSNTYHFYLRGWRGVNVDAIPGSMKIFKKIRGGDQNIEACIGEKSGEQIQFFEFKEAAFSTFDSKMAEEAKGKGAELRATHDLSTTSFEDLLSQVDLDPVNVDFLNIDIEGIDGLVLKSNDFSLFRPKVIAFEDHRFNWKDPASSEILNHLENNGYVLSSVCGPTIIVKSKDCLFG